MATSGSVTTSYLGSRAIKVTWSLTSQDVATNKSTLSWSLRGAGSGSYGLYIGRFRVTCNGSSVYSSNPQVLVGKSTLIASGTRTLTHDSTGECSFRIHVEAVFADENDPREGNGTFELPVIPRSSTLTIAPGVLGTEQSITINKSDAAFLHTISYVCGSASGTIVEKTADAVVNWTPPITLAAENTSGTALTCTFTLTTYSGETSIGTHTADVAYTIPANSSTRPTTSMGVSLVSELPAAFTGVYVQKKTKALIAFTEGAAKQGASIAGYAATLSGKSYVGQSVTTDYISQAGTLSVVGACIDSRGISSESCSSALTVVPYDPPSITPYTNLSSVEIFRCDEDGTASSAGIYLRVRAGRRFSSVNSLNTCVLRYRFKEADGGSYSGWTTILSGSAESNVIDTVLSGVVSNINKSYDVQLGAADLIGETAEITVRVPSQNITLHLGAGGNSVGIGRRAYSNPLSGRLDVGWDTNLEKDLSVSGDAVFSGEITIGAQTLLDTIYPVGSIYMSVSNVSPQTFFGGTWTALQNRFLVGAGDAYAVNATGGETEHTLTLDEMPAHAHRIKLEYGAEGNAQYPPNVSYSQVAGTMAQSQVLSTGPIEELGGGQAHNNLPPYLAVYMWKRTA